MFKKYFIFTALSIGLLLTGLGQAAAASLSSPRQTGILWKIDKPGYKPSYLLGSIHSDDLRVIEPADIVLEKLSMADSFVAELKMDSMSMQEASRLMSLPPGQTLESLIGTKRYQKCVSLLARYHIPESSVQRMKPWAVMVTLSMPRPRSGIVLDHRLYQEAERQGKKTYGLETNREQVAVFESFSLQHQIMMLDDAIKEFEHLPALFDELIKYYLRRDLTGLERVSEQYMLQANDFIARNFKQRALLDRNYLMVRRMRPRLMEGNSFIVVGALHLPGDEGILRLLGKEGYTVTPVY